MQAFQRKTEKFFVSEEKKFGRIDSRHSIFSDKVDLRQATRVRISTIRESRNNDKEC